MTRAIPTAFLDRDGVLNIDRGFVFRPEELEFVEDAAAAVRLLNETGYRVVVVTNQSGVARGLIYETALRLFHEHMQAELSMGRTSTRSITALTTPRAASSNLQSTATAASRKQGCWSKPSANSRRSAAAVF